MSKKWGFDNHRAGEKGCTDGEITDRRQAEEALQHQLEFERIVARISTAFVNIDNEELDDAINYALRLSGEFFRVDRSYIFQAGPDGKVMNNTHEWCAPGVEPQIDKLQNDPIAAFPWWYKELNSFKVINIPDVNSMPPEAEAEKEMLKAQDIQSVLVVPLMHRQKLIGFLGFDAVRQPKRWAEGQISLLKIVSEVISGTLARVQAEKELQESERRFRALVQNTPDIIAIVNEKGEYCYASPSLERVMGYTPAAQEKLNALDLLHPDDREMAASLFGGLLQRAGDTIGMKFRMRHRDGSYRYINALGQNLLQDPSVGGIVVNARDVTEQKRAAAETVDALVKFKATFENTRDAITLCALKKNIFVDCNTRALELFGLNSKEEFLHNHPSDFSPPLQPDGQYSATRSGELVKQLMKDGGSTSFEWLHQRKDGSVFPADVTLTTYKLADDVILQANIRDISYRKEVEQKLAAYTRELEQLYRHLDAEMDKARRIHERAFSANFPRVEGFTFAAYYQPAQRLGGDFYDVIRVDNKLVLYLSDVMGHGIDGAMLSLFVKEAIESYVSLKKNELEPHKILHHLNTQYRKSNYPDDYFIAIFLSVLDLDRMELYYAAAGFQDAPLVACRGGERFELLASSLPISSTLAQELFALQTEKIELSPGMCILFNTDGLTEQAVKEGYYYQRLKEVFYRNSHLPAPEVLRAVIEDFQLVNNGSLQGDDDITLLVLQLDA